MDYETEIMKIFEDEKIYALAKFLLSAGAGTILPHNMQEEGVKKLIAYELAYAAADPRPTEWETEIAKLVLARDEKKMIASAKQLWQNNPRCPLCLNGSGLRRRIRTTDWYCDECKKVVFWW